MQLREHMREVINMMIYYIAPHGMEYGPSIVTELNSTYVINPGVWVVSSWNGRVGVGNEQRGTKGSLRFSFRVPVLSHSNFIPPPRSPDKPRKI